MAAFRIVKAFDSTVAKWWVESVTGDVIALCDTKREAQDVASRLNQESR